MMSEEIISFTLGLFLLGAILIHKSSRKVDSLTRRRRWKKYLAYLLIVHVVIGSALAGTPYFTLLVSMLGVIGACELLRVCWRKDQPRSRVAGFIIIVVGYLALLYGLIRFSQFSSVNEIIFVYLVTASLDGFSQLTGQWIGRIQLAPHISPNKTVEGAFGGLVGALLTAFALRSLLDLSAWQAPRVGLVLALAGLTGDLIASYVKRLNHVKDFGQILPEHGGVLDRFDSLLLAAPTFFIWRG